MPAVRKAALGILPGLSMSSAAKVRSSPSLIKAGSLAERQGALEVLGTLRTAESRELLGQYLDEFEAGKIAPEIQVDLVDAAQADGFPAFVSRLDAFRKGRSAETLALGAAAGAAHRGRRAARRPDHHGQPRRRVHPLPLDGGHERRAAPGEDRRDALA